MLPVYIYNVFLMIGGIFVQITVMSSRHIFLLHIISNHSDAKCFVFFMCQNKRMYSCSSKLRCMKFAGCPNSSDTFILETILLNLNLSVKYVILILVLFYFALHPTPNIKSVAFILRANTTLLKSRSMHSGYFSPRITNHLEMVTSN